MGNKKGKDGFQGIIQSIKNKNQARANKGESQLRTKIRKHLRGM